MCAFTKGIFVLTDSISEKWSGAIFESKCNFSLDHAATVYHNHKAQSMLGSELEEYSLPSSQKHHGNFQYLQSLHLLQLIWFWRHWFVVALDFHIRTWLEDDLGIPILCCPTVPVGLILPHKLFIIYTKPLGEINTVVIHNSTSPCHQTPTKWLILLKLFNSLWRLEGK